MKSQRISGVSLSLFLVLFIFHAPGLKCLAQSQQAVGNATVKSDSLVAYAGMSMTSAVVKTLKKGDKVRVRFEVGTSAGSWCAIREAGQTEGSGYVLCRGLEREDRPKSPVPSAAESEPTSQSASTLTGRASRPEKKPLRRSRPRYGIEGLCLAALDGDLAEVRARLAAGEDVNAKCANGSTALLTAAYNGHNVVVRTLLAAGADIQATDSDGENAVIEATYNDHRDTIKILAEAGVDVNQKGRHGSTALSRAVNWSRAATVRTLLDLGADPDAGVTEYGSPLATAIRRCKIKGPYDCGIIQMLRDAGGRE